MASKVERQKGTDKMEQKPSHEISTVEPVGSEANTLKPVSSDPRDNGLFIVTTYDDFFRVLPCEQSQREENTAVVNR